jgi:hypothetical protein
MSRNTKASEIATPSATPTTPSITPTPDVIATIHGQTVPALPRTFSSGSKGYFGVGKLVIGGRKYQAQVQLVEIGSKPKA